ncbi:unnamed protein product [Arabis nemorensis]|uniref:Kinesin motor domain-containing protein n=1 Tax=Arabis nemorensis TaxID=586526 RepID=A0A565BNB6_9BRAS|nr:unnamed protein product [Arabis nemorensis]
MKGDGGNASDAVRVSVLNLVDLVGSEHAAETREEECSHIIDKSLMTLGTVMKKLSEGVDRDHVPYRDSKLTRICITCRDETRSSLRFASRALRVTKHAHINEVGSKSSCA